MEMEININLDNAAFEEYREEEIKRILDTINFSDGQTLIDFNGNAVGKVRFTDEEKNK